jgi:hypothetical protein
MYSGLWPRQEMRRNFVLKVGEAEMHSCKKEDDRGEYGLEQGAEK